MSARDNADAAVEWDGQTHHHRERSVDWFWALGLIAVVAAVVAAWFGDVLFSAIVIIASVAIGIGVSRKPRDLAVRVDGEGIHVDNDTYSYESIRSFWIHTEFVPSPRLHLRTTYLMHPELSLTVPSLELAEEVRVLLLNHGILEDEQHTGGTMLADLLGF